MKLSKIIGYGVATAVLLGILGWVPLVSTPIRLVKITILANCQTKNTNPCPGDGDTACVNVGTRVQWLPPPSTNHTYSADFGRTTPFATTSVPAGPSGSIVTGGNGCPHPNTNSDVNCYFQYEIHKDSTLKCLDPGVRVVPPNNSSIFYWLLVHFGFAGR